MTYTYYYSRHDLRPAADTAEGVPGAEGDELPPPLADHEAAGEATTGAAHEDRHRPRVSRFMDLHRLRTAPAEERIAALRELREQSRADGTAMEDVEDPSRRTRLTGRLRDTFRIRTQRETPPQSTPPA